VSVFSRVLVANRGEVALRVIRTLRRMGIASAVVYADPDSASLAVRRADCAVRLESELANPYLDPQAVVEAARRAGADALHPGYGFLSENPRLARATAEAGITFVGPPPLAMELMGDKINAKEAAARAGVPVVPGLDERHLSTASLEEAVLALGLPVMLKPAAGGGGKGMRVVFDPATLTEELEAARREAAGAFGDPTLLVERFVADPRHVEVQVFADRYGQVVTLGERECSLQRRHQKVIEEAPSPLLDPSLRERMCEAAAALARSCGYEGAGTVEFVVPGASPGEFAFMEMNTRLQVEHPVTEATWGVDLVEWQLRVAAGESLEEIQARCGGEPKARGWAFEARIYAEDPSRGFLPSGGEVVTVHFPRARGLRLESALEPGTQVSSSFDPMLAKVIAWGADRQEALGRLRDALGRTRLLGVATNLDFLRAVLERPEVSQGNLDTGLLERLVQQTQAPRPPDQAVAAAGLVELALLASRGVVVRQSNGHAGDPWRESDCFRPGGAGSLRLDYRLPSDDLLTVVVTPAGPNGSRGEAGDVAGEVAIQGGGTFVGWARLARGDSTEKARRGQALVSLDGLARTWDWAEQGSVLWLGDESGTWSFSRHRRRLRDRLGEGRGSGRVRSPMPATVAALHVGQGQAVNEGDPLVSVEAMKMEHLLRAPLSGVVSEVLVRPGQSVALDQHLVTVSAVAPAQANAAQAQ